MNHLSSIALVLPFVLSVDGFSSVLFQEAPAARQTFPSKTNGVEIELPDFDELFGRAMQVSPLARAAIESAQTLTEKRGFEAAGETCE